MALNKTTNLVKFGYGLLANKPADNNVIYFATDTNEIYAQGQAFGLSSSALANLNSAITSGTWVVEKVEEVDTNRLKLTNVDGSFDYIDLRIASTTQDGLMSKDDKKILDTLNGEASVTGSVKKQINDAINDLDSTITAEDGKFITSVTVEDGKITGNTKGSLTSTNQTISIDNFDIDVKVDGTTIVIDDTEGHEGELKVISSALAQYEGENAIEIGDEENGIRTVSLTVNTNDKVLTNDSNGLMANINLTYEDVNLGTESNPDLVKHIILKGKNGTEIAKINTSDFIKDSVLSSVELSASGEGHAAEYGPYLVFTWNADSSKEATWVSVKSLVDVYTAGNGVDITNNVVKVVKSTSSDSEDFLSVDSTGIKVSGIQDAIDEAAAAATTVVTGESSASGPAVKVTMDNSATDGHVEYKVAGQDLASAALLGTISDTAAANTAFGKIAAEVSRATTAEDTIEASVGLTTAGAYSNSGNYIGKNESTNTVASDIKALDTALNSLDGEVVKSVEVNNVSGTVTGNVASVTIDGGDIALTDYTAITETTPNVTIASTDTVNVAVAKVDRKISDNATQIANLSTRVTNITGQTGASYTKNTSAPYISTAENLNDADVKLAAAISALEDYLSWYEGVSDANS